jgi:hypothetical protein
MKKIKLLFLFLIFVLCSAAADKVCAQEKIFSFDVEMQVQKDGSAIVSERISLNAQGVKIRRGIYRDIPKNAEVPIEIISLTMDGFTYPYFTENKGKTLRVNFGDDNFISKGRHTYEFTYKVLRLVGDFDDYDEVYWNVTGNDWDFTIDEASFKIVLPSGADINKDLVSLYTGKIGAKGTDALKYGDNFYKTGRPLKPGEGFTVAVPFAKGVVASYKHLDPVQLPQKAGGFLFYAAFIFAVLLFYYIFTWFKAGRDPVDTIVTEFAPPENISAAFMRCLWKRRTDEKGFAVALASLAMKGKIEISEEKSFLSKSAALDLKDKNTVGLPEEEKTIMSKFFASGRRFGLTSANWPSISSCMSSINKRFDDEKKKYIISNAKYTVFPALALLLMQPAFIGGLEPLIFVNFHFCIFVALISTAVKSNSIKIPILLAVSAFYFMFFKEVLGQADISYIAIEILFVLEVFGFAIYASIIDNLTAQGRLLFIKIKGFYRYMTVAEERRVAMSDPLDAEKIFADYLPYAFAFDMENKWMEEFEKVLPRATTDRYYNALGGRNAFARGLILSSINSAAPKSSSSGGSGGRGFSGGGFGGGGGGGR